MFEKIHYYEGGFALQVTSLDRDGNITSTGYQNRNRHISPELTNQAFECAENEKPIPENVQLETGCCRSGNGVSEFFKYKDKKFHGTPFLVSLFTNRKEEQFAPEKHDVTHILPPVHMEKKKKQDLKKKKNKKLQKNNHTILIGAFIFIIFLIAFFVLK